MYENYYTNGNNYLVEIKWDCGYKEIKKASKFNIITL